MTLFEEELIKEFVPRDIADRLKDIGFNKPCFGVYRDGTILITIDPEDHYYYEDSAPTFAQVFRWFVEIEVSVGVPWFHYSNYSNNSDNLSEDLRIKSINMLIEKAQKELKGI